MAWEILQGGPQIKHQPKHDLESLFYVLIWICVNYTGPHGEKRVDWDIFMKAAPLGRWLDPSKEFEEVATIKLGQFSHASIFVSQILSLFSEYFKELKPCCLDLRAMFFPGELENRDITHAGFLSILETTLHKLSCKGPTEKPISDDTRLTSIDPFTPIITRATKITSHSEQTYEDTSGNHVDKVDFEEGDFYNEDEFYHDQPPRKKIAVSSAS
jgi:hypothetical protein